MFASIIQHWTFHPASFHRGRVASWARGVKWIMAHDGHTWFISNSRSIHPLSAPAGDQYVVDWTFVSTFFPPRQLLIDLGSQRVQYMYMSIVSSCTSQVLSLHVMSAWKSADMKGTDRLVQTLVCTKYSVGAPSGWETKSRPLGVEAVSDRSEKRFTYHVRWLKLPGSAKLPTPSSLHSPNSTLGSHKIGNTVTSVHGHSHWCSTELTGLG